MFGRRAKVKRPDEWVAETVTAMTDEAEAAKSDREIHQEVLAWLTAAAQSQTRDVLAAQEELLAGFVKAHEADRASFDFECRRWGDFLALMVQRGGVKVMQALDVGASAVELMLGHEPDRLGETSFGYVADDRSTWSGHYLDRHGFLRWPATGKFKVTPDHPGSYQRVAGIFQTKEWQRGDGYRRRSPGSDIPFTVPTAARPADDDVLRFAKTGVVMPVPANCGQSVYTAVLRELARGAEAA